MLTWDDGGVAGRRLLLEILSLLRISADFSSSALSYRYMLKNKSQLNSFNSFATRVEAYVTECGPKF